MPSEPPQRPLGTSLLGGLTLTLLGVAVALALTHPPAAERVPPVELGFAISFAGLAVTGVLAAWARPTSPVGLVLVGAALGFVLPVAAGEYAVHVVVGGREWPGGDVAAWLSSWPQPVAYGLLIVALPLLFPSGELPPRWRRPARAVACLAVLSCLALAVRPGPLNGLVEITNPYGTTALGAAPAALAGLAPPLITLAGLAALISMALRFRRSDGEVRAQFRLVGFAVGVLVLTLAARTAAEASGSGSPALLGTLTLAGFCAVPLGLGLALTRYRLYDADRLIDRAVVYAVVSAGIVLLYVTAVTLLGGALGRRVDLAASVLAAVIAAVLFPLLREGTQRLVARRVYGWRDDPYAVLSSLGSRLDGVRPDRLLEEAVEQLAVSLRLPWVALLDAEGVTQASAGQPRSHVTRLDLSSSAGPAGTLEVSPRTGERDLPERDRRVLKEAGRPLAAAMREAALTRDLLASRERLVRAREEERRRLRRDLHDGLGPVLTGVTLGLDGVLALIDDDPRAAAAMAERVRAEAAQAVTEVRRAVDGLRPPALDQLGLAAALAQRAAALSSASLQITVHAPGLPDLPAAVEVACYAVAVEAMTNVVRHADATCCEVRIEVADVLVLQVKDDGNGQQGAPGVGQASFRERADELGGSLTVHAQPGRGTVVRLELPVQAR